MRASRGMGAMRASKMPGKKIIKRKDNPDDVAVYAKGGEAKFIQKAIKKPGALRAELGVAKGKKIPAKKLAKAAKAPGKLGQRARFAQTLAKLNKPKRMAEGGSTKDECYSKVKARYKVFPSAYASGAIAKCRKVGAKNWGNKGGRS